MANNTFNGMTSDNVAMEGISTLEKALVPIAAFSMDLSIDIAEKGDVVKTRIVPSATAATDLVDNESGNYDSIVDDQTTTLVSVTLDPHPVTGFAFTDSEAQSIASGVWTDTSRRLVKSHIRGIAEDVLDELFALITNANYGAAALTTLAVNFDADDVADLRTVAVNAGWNMDDEPILGLNPDYYGALIKDDAIQDFSASQITALRDGKLPKLSGFQVMEMPTLPGNSENLTGFIALKDAMAIAMRGVDTQDRGQFLTYQILQGDVVPATITYSALWTSKKRQVEHIFEALFGVVKAQGASLKRIVSA